MNRISRTAFAVLAALTMGAGHAAAQTVSSPFRYLDRKTSVEAFGGYLFTDAEVTIDTANAAEFGPQSAPVFGVRAARRITGPLSAELMVGFSPSERRIIAAAEGQDSAFTGPLDTGSTVGAPLLMTEAGVRFHLTGDRTYRGFAPFILATGGLVFDVGGASAAEDSLPEDERFDFGPALAVGAGTGADWYLGERLSLRAEASYRLWRMSVPQGFTFRRTGESTEWNGVAGLTLGAAFHF
ncbi:MAG TPA: hypothetical protein VE913_19625 [Longimicrobium sp.]|nr:hypothetical protein [Longimicrobium sp.]